MNCCIRPLLPDHTEVNHAGQARRQAVEAERDEAASTQVPDQEPDRRVRSQAGQHAAEHDLPADAAAQRLHAKGLLERERTGRAFVYRPVDDASRAASQMSQALETGSDHGAVLSRFVSGLSGRDARLLRDLLGEAGGDLLGEAGD
jgi:hypothetical protein